MPTHGSCLPLTDIDVFFPNLSIVFLEERIEEVGFTQLHLCNTIPQYKGGGLSGPALKPYVFTPPREAQRQESDLDRTNNIHS